MLVSADFLMSFSRMMSISVSICIPMSSMNSLMQIRLFLETLDRRFYTMATMSSTRAWMLAGS